MVVVSQRTVVDEATGEMRDALAHDWAMWLDHAGTECVPLPSACEEPEMFVERAGARAVILSGGGSISPLDVSGTGMLARASLGAAAPEHRRDRAEARVLARAMERGMPVLGVCRGMQFINRALGGRTRAGIASPRKTHPAPGQRHAVRVTDVMTSITLARPGENAEVNSYHNDGAMPTDLAPSLRALALSEDGLVEAVVHERAAVAGVQWHPERDREHAWNGPLIAFLLRGAHA